MVRCVVLSIKEKFDFLILIQLILIETKTGLLELLTLQFNHLDLLCWVGSAIFTNDAQGYFQPLERED